MFWEGLISLVALLELGENDGREGGSMWFIWIWLFLMGKTLWLCVCVYVKDQGKEGEKLAHYLWIEGC